MSLPIVGQKYPPQVRMSVEDNSKQIESFAFVPICRAPNAGNCRHVRVVFVNNDLQPQAMMLCCRKQMVVHFESRLFFHTAVRTANIRKEIKLRVRASFKFRTYFNDVSCRNDRCDFAQRLDDLASPIQDVHAATPSPIGTASISDLQLCWLSRANCSRCSSLCS